MLYRLSYAHHRSMIQFRPHSVFSKADRLGAASQFKFESSCRGEKPGNANLPIGVLCFATVANREMGVFRLDSEVTAAHSIERISLNWDTTDSGVWESADDDACALSSELTKTGNR